MQRFMVVEHFKPGCLDAVYARFHERGRMLPAGVHYLNSWVNKEANICFQLMEARDASLFQAWFDQWSDLVEFEVFPIDS